MSELTMTHTLGNNSNRNDKGNIKEEVRMSIVSMAMNIGSYKINLTVNKNQLKKMKNRFEYSHRVKEAIEAKNDSLIQYGMYNFLM